MNRDELKDLEMPALLDLYLAEIKEMALLREDEKITNERFRESSSRHSNMQGRLYEAGCRVTLIDAEIHHRMGNPQ